MVLTMFFTILNMLYCPLAYIGHTIALIRTVTDSDETMDELDEKIARVYTIIWFIFLGPIYIIMSVFVDMYSFWINLYSKPLDV